MIQQESKLVSADNTGAKVLECIKVLGGTRRRYAGIGDVITVSVKTADPRSMVKSGEVARAVIVRQKKAFRRKDGSYVRFDENAAVLVPTEGNAKEPRGSRVFGPVPRELKAMGYPKIVSLAPKVL